MTPEQFAAKHEGHFRIDILNIALAVKVGTEGDLREATKILLADILQYGRDCALLSAAKPSVIESPETTTCSAPT
jgi:hypothetical protein